MTASSVWCRSGAVTVAAAQQREPVLAAAARSPRPTSRAPSPRPARSASGSPSRRSTRPRPRSASRRTPGRAAVARSRNSSTRVVVGRAAAAGRRARRRSPSGRPGRGQHPERRAVRDDQQRPPGRRPPRPRARSCRGPAASGPSPRRCDDPGAHVGALLGGVSAPSAADRVADPERRADLDRHAVRRGHAGELDEVHDRLRRRAGRSRGRAGSCPARRAPTIETTREVPIRAAARATSSSRPSSGSPRSAAPRGPAGRRRAARRAARCSAGPGSAPSRSAAARGTARSAPAPPAAPRTRPRCAAVPPSRSSSSGSAAAAASSSGSALACSPAGTAPARAQPGSRSTAAARLAAARRADRRRPAAGHRHRRAPVPARGRSRARAVVAARRAPAPRQRAGAAARRPASARTPEPVAVPGAHHRVGAVADAGARHQHLQRLGRVGRRVVAPHLVDQPLRRRPPRGRRASAASSACGRSPGTGAPRQRHLVEQRQVRSRRQASTLSLSAGRPRAARRRARRRRRGRRRVSASVRVRSGARKRSAKASDFVPGPTCVAGVDVEEPDRLQQVAGALAQRRLDLGRGHVGRRPRGRRPPWPPGTSENSGARHDVAARADQEVEVDLDGRGARAAAPNAAHTVRVQLAGVADSTPPTRSPAHRPGCHGCRLAGATSTSTPSSRADVADHARCVRPGGGAARAPPAGGLALAGQDDGEVQRLGRHRLDQLVELGVGRAATPRRRIGAGRGRSGRRRCRSRRAHAGGAAAEVAGRGLEQARAAASW